MSPDGWLQVLNALRRAQWAVRWFVGGGSSYWRARDLPDLRTFHEIGLGQRIRWDMSEARLWILRSNRARAKSVLVFGKALEQMRHTEKHPASKELH